MFNVRNIPIARHFQGRILLCGASSIAGSHNFGDDLFTAIYVEWLHNLCPNVDIAILQYNSYANRKVAWPLLFKQADALLFIGGGYFGEPNFPGMGVVRRKLRQFHWALRNSLLYGGAFHTARRHRVPHGVIGVEFGPIRSGPFRRCAVRILQQARVCALRNSESARYAQEYGVLRRDLGVHVDAVMSLTPEQLPYTAVRTYETMMEGSQTFRIGVNLNSLSAAHWKESDVIIRLVKSLQDTAPAGKPVSLFFLHDQTVNGQHPKTRLSAELFLKEHFPDITIVPFQGHWEMVGTLAAMHVVVTTKLHVGVTSRALSVPVLAIPGHYKTERFYRFIGEQDFCIPADRLRGAQIPSSLSQMVKNWTPESRFPVSLEARRSAEQNKELLKVFISELPRNKRSVAA